MTAWRRAIRWLMLALACAALGAAVVPSRALAQQDPAAQIERVARAARAKATGNAQSAPGRRQVLRPHAPRNLRAPARGALLRPDSRHLPAPPGGRLYLKHRSLLR